MAFVLFHKKAGGNCGDRSWALTGSAELHSSLNSKSYVTVDGSKYDLLTHVE